MEFNLKQIIGDIICQVSTYRGRGLQSLFFWVQLACNMIPHVLSDRD